MNIEFCKGNGCVYIQDTGTGDSKYTEVECVWIHIGSHIHTDIRTRIHIYRHKDKETQTL